jgi:hypothetical protein
MIRARSAVPLTSISRAAKPAMFRSTFEPGDVMASGIQRAHSKLGEEWQKLAKIASFF